jgi:hypothetical protein
MEPLQFHEIDLMAGGFASWLSGGSRAPVEHHRVDRDSIFGNSAPVRRRSPRPHSHSSSDYPGAILVSDPNTVMPMAVWAIQAYLTIWEVAHEIDSVQYTFPKFLQVF